MSAILDPHKRPFITYLPLAERRANREGYIQGIIEVATKEGIENAESLRVGTRWDSLKMDSLDFISFIDAADTKFDTVIPQEVAAKWETVGEMLDWLEQEEEQIDFPG